MLKLVGGVLAVLFGVGICGWSIYLLLNPDAATTSRSPIRGVIFGLIMAGVGVKWLLAGVSESQNKS